jgi:exopolysaccharide production protein ExoZ
MIRATQAIQPVVTQKIHPIQYLRGIAALLVVWFHAVGTFGHLYEGFGNVGVDIFFVISGFIMIVTTWQKDISPRRFLALRIVRVVPLYWIATLCMALLSSASAIDTLRSVAFIPYSINPVLYPGWTLNFEMFFYLIFALSLFSRHRLLLLAGIMLLIVGVGYAHHWQGLVAKTYTNSMLLEFLGGAALGYLWVSRRLAVGLPLSIGAVMTGVVFVVMRGHNGPIVIRLIGVALLIVGCLHPRICAYKGDVLTKMGDASYSTYLSHPFILIAMAAMYHPVTWTWESSMTFVLVGCVLCQITGWLCYRLIEQPMTQWLQGFMPSKRYAYSPAISPA